jgi:NAD(P)-dependent dehydrogenase (short-subunit alcohol dehydrogenase family)
MSSNLSSDTSPVYLVTGATDGIGWQTAMELGREAGRVLVHGRTQAKAQQACDKLVAAYRSRKFEPVAADLASLTEVRAMAKRVLEMAPVLDVLINNAGVFMPTRVLTPDGREMTMAVNHDGHFLLTYLLLPALKAAPGGRVVNVSSMAHAYGRIDLTDLDFASKYDGNAAYASSKLANVLFTHELARRLQGTRVTVNALHPGVIRTKLLALGFGSGGAPLETGAKTSVYVATAPTLSEVSGRYFADARETRSAKHAKDEALEKAFFASSEKRVDITWSE